MQISRNKNFVIFASNQDAKFTARKHLEPGDHVVGGLLDGGDAVREDLRPPVLLDRHQRCTRR